MRTTETWPVVCNGSKGHDRREGKQTWPQSLRGLHPSNPIPKAELVMQIMNLPS